MENNKYYVIGVMSGTSLDGIDICYFELQKYENWSFKIIKELEFIDKEYSQFLSELIGQFISKYNVRDDAIVCSHGHTVFHNPKEFYTKQIGNRVELKTYIKNTIICDFRVQDVKFGGQGAPLVPIGDKLLFSKYEYCLNLGGFANISFDKNQTRVAYDICPVNIVLNYLSNFLNLEYDNSGIESSKGKIIPNLLSQLNSLEYYELEYPKSLGLEWVKKEIFPILDIQNNTINDLLRTFTEHIAIKIGYALSASKDASVLVTGGGAFNTFLMKRISNYTKHTITIPEVLLIEYKEALIFGLLGILKLRNEVNCLKSVTGAKCNHSSGKIYR
jgi:anhydro-N-acetylmuramic acid kinase